MGRAVSMGRPHLLRPLTEDRTCCRVGGFSEGIKPKTRRSATRSSVGPVRVNRLAPSRCLSPDTFPSEWVGARGGEACTVDHDVPADGLKASYPHSGTRPEAGYDALVAQPNWSWISQVSSSSRSIPYSLDKRQLQAGSMTT
jgi:hypothetical protein